MLVVSHPFTANQLFTSPPKKEKEMCVDSKMGKAGIWEYRLDIAGIGKSLEAMERAVYLHQDKPGYLLLLC